VGFLLCKPQVIPYGIVTLSLCSKGDISTINDQNVPSAKPKGLVPERKKRKTLESSPKPPRPTPVPQPSPFGHQPLTPPPRSTLRVGASPTTGGRLKSEIT